MDDFPSVSAKETTQCGGNEKEAITLMEDLDIPPLLATGPYH
jgi:hypothetical protein